MSSESLGKKLRKRLIIEVGCLEVFVLGFILLLLLGAFFCEVFSVFVFWFFMFRTEVAFFHIILRGRQHVKKVNAKSFREN